MRLPTTLALYRAVSLQGLLGAWILTVAGISANVLAASPVPAAGEGPSSAVVSEVQSAANHVTRWLAASPHSVGWHAYLRGNELETQLRLGDLADPQIVARLLERCSTGAPELQNRRFVALRLALRNWLVHLSPRSGGSLPSDNRGALLLAGLERSTTLRGGPSSDAAGDAVGQLVRTPELRLVTRRFPGLRNSSARTWAPLLGPGCFQYLAEQPPEPPETKLWQEDYAAACREARRRQALLFIAFYDPSGREAEAIATGDVERALSGTRGLRYVIAQLPLDHRTSERGRSIRLLDHASFADLRGRPGIAIIDYESPGAGHDRHVVSLFPRRGDRSYSQAELAVMLDLPPGTLTQRTLIYAVRTHHEAPRSAIGLPHHELLGETESHSQHQAEIAVQGHHQWDARFHRINAKLGDLISREVVAESWPGESLLEGAIECVRCWRTSEGHWDAVNARHAEYAYDIKLGANGVWYATGIFGD